MKKKMTKLSIKIAILFCMAILAGCSTTKRLGEDEVLYVGVKSMNIESQHEEGIDAATKSEVKAELSVKPNNPLYSPYWRTPFPFGLLVYNYCRPTKDKGFKYWFYNKFSREPVLISSVAPDLRMKLVESMLGNAGYFNSTATYDLLYKKRNDKKARISYQVDVAKPWVYGDISFPEVTDTLTSMINKIKDASLLRPGLRYDTDTLEAERVRIATYLRNNGYYFFRPEYIRFLADTTQAAYKVMIKVVLQDPLPRNAVRQYKIGKINVYIARSSRRIERSRLLLMGMEKNTLLLSEFFEHFIVAAVAFVLTVALSALHVASLIHALLLFDLYFEFYYVFWVVAVTSLAMLVFYLFVPFIFAFKKRYKIELK